MRRAIRWGAAVLALALGAGLAAPPGQAGDVSTTIVGGRGASGLDLYRITAPPAEVDRLRRAGYDVAATRPDGTTEIVLSPGELARLTAAGHEPIPWHDAHGRSVADLARAQLDRPGPTVWKRWEGPGGLRTELEELAAAHPQLVQTQVIGRSVQGRDILAARVTGGAPGVPDGSRPAVVYVALQHAREWISGEVSRRLLRSLVDAYGFDPEMTRLLDSTELWFVPVANPDGYELTFEPGRRLWRKNAADNNGDGKLEGGDDGVDINRNFPDHWGWAPLGSSDVPGDQAYRGRGPASEPETQALVGLTERIRPRFLVNYHSFGQLLLYPIGWQEQTPTADHPIYAALAGTPVKPGIAGYNPQLAADLYPTNGETSSWAHAIGTLAFTVELGEGVPTSGFLFPDNEALVEQEYQRNRPFALDVARSAADPAHPVSHLGNRVPSFVVDEFPVSYGDPQPVQAAVLRRLGPVEVRWQVGNGPEHRAPAVEWGGGLRYGRTGVYAHRVRGSVTGTKPGDRVKVWFTAGGEKSETFSYRVENQRDARVLVVVGGERRQLPTPPGAAPRDRLGPVLAALAANGIKADTYDVDAHDRVAPDPLGVLGHYDVVVWTTDEEREGDAFTSVPATKLRGAPGYDTVSRLANEEMLAARDYLNQGGRLLYMGRNAGRPYADGARYDPVADGPCTPRPPGPGVEGEDHGSGHCEALSEEFFQYWLGAYANAPGGGRHTDSRIAPVDGVRAPFDGISWAFTDTAVAPGRSAAAYAATAELLAAGYPQLQGRTAARYRISRAGAGGPGRAARYGWEMAAVVETPWSLLFGFGLEDVAGADRRAELMRRALRHLLAPG